LWLLRFANKEAHHTHNVGISKVMSRARWWHGKLLGAQCGQRIDVRGAAGGEKAGSIPAPATFFKDEA
jgi:hypothetical protein